MHNVLVLGGYGFFGDRIAASLSQDPGIRVWIGGRHREKALAACAAHDLPPERAVDIDASKPGVAATLRERQVQTLIHTAGPFQGQNYAVARAAIDAGCHCIDLADGRQFVTGITALDAPAKERGVSVISGASSVPALSSAVVDRYAGAFSRLDAIHIGIGSGGKTPGLATMQSVFGYCGMPIRRLEDGRWTQTYGWLGSSRYRFADPVGARWLGSADVPDLDLLPARYPSVKTVTFRAGFASAPAHFFVTLLAWLVKRGVLGSVTPWAKPLNRIGRWWEPLMSDKGGMFVELEGTDHHGQPKLVRWNLVATHNDGPSIPCAASIALARKLASGAPLPHGAMPCTGLLTVEEFLAPLAGLHVREVAP